MRVELNPPVTVPLAQFLLELGEQRLLLCRFVSCAAGTVDEHHAVEKAKAWVQGKTAELPALKQYLDNWGDWSPWP